MKAMLDEWETRKPGVRQSMLHALQTVRPSHLHDERVWDFAGLAAGVKGPGDDGVPF